MRQTNKKTFARIIPTDVAIWSLCVAVLALSVNAFMSQKAERNLNTRQAAFELIMQLGELDNITNQIHYSNVDKDSWRIDGWGNITLIQDLSILLNSRVETKAKELLSVWQVHHSDLGESENTEALTEIRLAIDNLRLEIKNLLKTL